MKNIIGNQRGIGLVATALWILAFFAIVAVGVDVGRISFAASEVQSATDVAATVAAAALVNGRTPATDVALLLGSANNTIDSHTASAALDAPPTLETGTVTSDGTFTPGGGAAANAVRATAVATVRNLFAGVFGPASSRTTITKTAVAALSTIADGAPGLPLVVSGACFNNSNCTAGNCPTLSTQANTAGWTGYTSGASDSTIRGFVPASPGCGGGGRSGPLLSVNDSVNVSNGTLANSYRDAQCLFCADPNREYLIPVVNVACGGNFNGGMTVTGFATIKIDHFVDQNGNTVGCGGNPKGIVLKSLRRADESGGIGGCANCGSGMVRLIG